MTAGRRSEAEARLRRTLADELRQPVLPEARHVVEHAIALHGERTGPIVFYGSCLRADSAEGVMDVYLLPASYRAFHGAGVMAALNWLVPPNIYFWTVEAPSGETLRAKVAAVSRDQFSASCADGAISPSVWARFCQPAALLHAPGDGALEAVAGDLTRAVVTGARWAARLGPEEGTPRDYWTALFRATYGAELRPEREDRPAMIYETHAARYDALLPDAWTAGGIAFDVAEGGRLRPEVGAAERRRAAAAWTTRQAQGKALSVLRVLKGVLTFEGAVDYLLWKIERHAGMDLEITDWQREHPVLAAPWVFVQLTRRGALR